MPSAIRQSLGAARIGDLRDRVTIQQVTTSADGQGGQTTSWSTLATVWASVVAESARESIAAAAVTARQVYTVIIRNRGDVTPSMRIQWTPYLSSSAKTLEVHGVQTLDGGRRLLRLECAEVL